MTHQPALIPDEPPPDPGRAVPRREQRRRWKAALDQEARQGSADGVHPIAGNERKWYNAYDHSVTKGLVAPNGCVRCKASPASARLEA